MLLLPFTSSKSWSQSRLPAHWTGRPACSGHRKLVSKAHFGAPLTPRGTDMCSPQSCKAKANPACTHLPFSGDLLFLMQSWKANGKE